MGKPAISPIAFMLIGLVVLLLLALGFRLPIGDSASALLALLVGALVYRHTKTK